jgi:hypothetical protein
MRYTFLFIRVLSRSEFDKKQVKYRMKPDIKITLKGEEK